MIEDNLLCDKDLFGENFFGELPVDLENVGLDDVNGETWSTALEDLELPMFLGGGQIVSLNDSRDSLRGTSKTSPKRKDGFHTTSPDSVLAVETSNSSSENPPIDPELKLSPKGKRSQRKPVSSIKLEQLSSLISLLSLVHTLHESAEQKHSRKRKRKDETTTTSESQISRICSHCGITKTPQWREGPNGPKTLCNACGVRYRSGRLLPEYRPAASPTFVPSMHSNSHKKIVEMRKKAEAMGKCAEMPSSPVSSVGLMSF